MTDDASTTADASLIDDAGYDDWFVDVYDQRASVQERDDVAFYRDLAADADGPALELACGTGRVYLDVLASGLDVDGFDASSAALRRLRERAADRGLEPSVWQGDLASFAVDREYALAYCPFNALQHLTTVDEQRGSLECVAEALEPGGRFVFDVFVPSFELICDSYGEWRRERVDYDDTEHVVQQRGRIVDEVEQTVQVDLEVRTTDGDVVEKSAFRIVLLSRQQVALLVRQSPLEAASVAGGFDGEPLSDGDSTQVWTLQLPAD